MTKYLAIIILACMMTTILTAASAESDDLDNLRTLIVSFEDTMLSSTDLAFFLATHNYDAVPKDDHVDLFLEGTFYTLVPNGNAPGLCDIVI